MGRRGLWAELVVVAGCFLALGAVGAGVPSQRDRICIGVEAPLRNADWLKGDFREQNAAMNAHEWLGWLSAKGGIDYVLQVDDHIDLYVRLGKVARLALRRGQRISRIVISGHGHPANPGIEFTKAIFKEHIDPGIVKKSFEESREKVWRIREELFGMDETADRTDAGARLKLEEKQYDMARQVLDGMEHVALAMSQDAGILMAVCFQGRTDGHDDFVRSLAGGMLYYGGGSVASPITALVLERENLMADWWEGFFGLDDEHGTINMKTQGKRDDEKLWGEISDTSRVERITGNWRVLHIEPSRRPLSPLHVTLTPDVCELQEGGSAILVAKADVFPDSGKMAYSWEGDGVSGTGDRFVWSAPEGSIALRRVDVVVRDERGREGRARALGSVRAKKPPGLEMSVTILAEVTDPDGQCRCALRVDVPGASPAGYYRIKFSFIDVTNGKKIEREQDGVPSTALDNILSFCNPKKGTLRVQVWNCADESLRGELVW